MRPRRTCLGCRRLDRFSLLPRRCFNEAEAHTPRMRIFLHGLRQYRASFNKAEAHTPRMRRSASSSSPATISSFNEAEAHTPRMLPNYNPLAVKAILADFRAIGAVTGKISWI
jgi:hypothetical protein